MVRTQTTFFVFVSLSWSSVVILIPVAWVISAVTLRTACRLYNRFLVKTPSPETVPVPRFGWAMLIALVLSVLKNLTLFFIALAFQNVSGMVGLNRASGLLLKVGTLPIEVVISAGVLVVMLPTNFRRAAYLSILDTVMKIFLLVALLLGGGMLIKLINIYLSR